MLDLTNQRFNRLTCIKRLETKKDGKFLWQCRCDCGKEVELIGSKVKNGRVKSCGCLVGENLTKHGEYKTRLYTIWNNILSRTQTESNRDYPNYGGRGIEICDEWKNSFENFRDWAHNNGYSDELTIDRINNDGNYSPNNCRWVTLSAQQNNKRTNRLIEYHGEVHNVSEWSQTLGINRSTLYNRLAKGWSVDRVFSKTK